jgi:hypothetical protein
MVNEFHYRLMLVFLLFIQSFPLSLSLFVFLFLFLFLSLSLSLSLTFFFLLVNPPSTPTVEVTPPQPQSESSSVPVSSAPQTEGSQPSESNTRISDSNVNDVQKLHLRLDHIEERLSKIEDTLIQILALLNSSSSSQQISSKEPK